MKSRCFAIIYANLLAISFIIPNFAGIENLLNMKGLSQMSLF